MYILDGNNSMLSRIASFHNNIINLEARWKSMIYHHAITSRRGQNFDPIRNKCEWECSNFTVKKIFIRLKVRAEIHVTQIVFLLASTINKDCVTELWEWLPMPFGTMVSCVICTLTTVPFLYCKRLIYEKERSHMI
jgi:hypothetical protein